MPKLANQKCSLLNTLDDRFINPQAVISAIVAAEDRTVAFEDCTYKGFE